MLVYAQEPIKYDMYMELLKGVEARFGKEKVLRLQKNFYGKKQTGQQFHIFARENLEKVRLKQLNIDTKMLYKDKCIILM